MKKVWNFILSFILPKRMLAHRDMNIFIVLLIILISFVSCTFISNLTCHRFIEKQPEKYLYFEEMIDNETLNEKAGLPTLEMNKNNTAVSDIKFQGSSNVIEKTFVCADNLPMTITLVYETNRVVVENNKVKEETAEIAFPLTDYIINKKPYNDKGEQTSRDILVIFTYSSVYYIFNHGYAKNKNGNPELYLDQSWSMFEDEEKTKVTQKIVDIFVNNNLNRTKTGYLEYDELKNMGEDVSAFNAETSWKDVANTFADIQKSSAVSQIKYQNGIYGIIFIVVLPFVWTFVIWILTRRFGELRLYREYLAICVSTMILPSILMMIFTIVLPYYSIAYWGMILMTAYFYMSVIVINGTRKRPRNDNSKQGDEISLNVNKNVNYEINTKSVSDYKKEEK